MTENDWKEMIPRLALRLRIKRLIAGVQAGVPVSATPPVARATSAPALPVAPPPPVAPGAKKERGKSPVKRARSPVKRGRSPASPRAVPSPAPVPASAGSRTYPKRTIKPKVAPVAKEEEAEAMPKEIPGPKKRLRSASQSPSGRKGGEKGEKAADKKKTDSSLAALAAAASILTSDEEAEKKDGDKKEREEGSAAAVAGEGKGDALAGAESAPAAPAAPEAAKTPGRRGGRKRSAANSPADGQAASRGGRSKVCQMCGKDRPLSEYHVDRHARDGLKGKCKDCKRQMTQELQQRQLLEGRSRRPQREQPTTADGWFAYIVVCATVFVFFLFPYISSF
jgi:hypothetical protein